MILLIQHLSPWNDKLSTGIRGISPTSRMRCKKSHPIPSNNTTWMEGNQVKQVSLCHGQVGLTHAVGGWVKMVHEHGIYFYQFHGMTTSHKHHDPSAAHMGYHMKRVSCRRYRFEMDIMYGLNMGWIIHSQMIQNDMENLWVKLGSIL